MSDASDYAFESALCDCDSQEEMDTVYEKEQERLQKIGESQCPVGCEKQCHYDCRYKIR